MHIIQLLCSLGLRFWFEIIIHPNCYYKLFLSKLTVNLIFCLYTFIIGLHTTVIVVNKLYIFYFVNALFSELIISIVLSEVSFARDYNQNRVSVLCNLAGGWNKMVTPCVYADHSNNLQYVKVTEQNMMMWIIAKLLRSILRISSVNL